MFLNIFPGITDPQTFFQYMIFKTLDPTLFFFNIEHVFLTRETVSYVLLSYKQLSCMSFLAMLLKEKK